MYVHVCRVHPDVACTGNSYLYCTHILLTTAHSFLETIPILASFLGPTSLGTRLYLYMHGHWKMINEWAQLPVHVPYGDSCCSSVPTVLKMATNSMTTNVFSAVLCRVCTVTVSDSGATVSESETPVGELSSDNRYFL